MIELIYYLVYKKRIFNLRELELLTGVQGREIKKIVDKLSREGRLSFLNLATLKLHTCKNCPLRGNCSFNAKGGNYGIFTK
ncbi:hypothetical protein [Caldisericum exile]|uniref:Transcriptional regulator HTH-type FeoC domain-containing protein n=1 Tax=Caldisericum exile (strain DSM 21853 / NBRC 104410 / AZM16c01) TaxID=511051 RepID=A0A7U6JFL4_CALEA|nr:hypothetical protein [Caldisericum exile]BAL80569.1 hypothetical protein CSE_04430 [Caldisericum exile AZM16c01]